ncbi:MAG TPA: phosphate ABC transporter substrate-binding protein PstS [Gemmatimonadales bacterium]|nr:phosphate ABC transporter substrate-binding protein PstS [Gemmatimonadales bacterium]
MTRNLLAATLAAILLGACGGGGEGGGGGVQARLTGAGATFPNPIYQRWSDAYNRETGIQVNYQSIGSGGGIRQFTEGTVDFGATDGPMTEEQLAAVNGNVIHVPTVLGAVVLTYNLPQIAGQTLVLDATTIADMYLGRISRWNDARIAALNPGVTLPAADLIVAHRSDGSGTTYVFTDYLSKVSEEWRTRVGTNTAVNWPTGLGGRGNEGVTQQVKQLPGALGYVELVYAISNQLPFAEVRNAAGNAVTPTLASVTAAAASAELTADTDFRVSITNPPGAAAYPIASFTWLLVHRDNPDATKAALVRDFVRWVLTPEAQQMALDLQYAPLPENALNLVTERLATLRAAGQPIP